MSALTSSASTFVRKSSFAPARRTAAKSMKVASRKNFQIKASVGVFFSTTTGNTEEVADMVCNEFGDAADPVDIGDIADSLGDMLEYDNLCVGAPTWNTGADSQRSGTSWDDVLEEIAGMDFSGKNVAVFGCGDSASYSDFFCDAIEEVHSTFAAAGATMVGNVSTEGYEFEESKSAAGGPASSDDASELIGLAIDVENQSDMSEDRVSAWVESLKSAGMA